MCVSQGQLPFCRLRKSAAWVLQQPYASHTCLSFHAPFSGDMQVPVSVVHTAWRAANVCEPRSVALLPLEQICRLGLATALCLSHMPFLSCTFSFCARLAKPAAYLGSHVLPNLHATYSSLSRLKAYDEAGSFWISFSQDCRSAATRQKLQRAAGRSTEQHCKQLSN